MFSAMLLDLNNSPFGTVGSTHGLPSEHPSYTDFSGSSFDQAGRVLYSSKFCHPSIQKFQIQTIFFNEGDSYRTESDMYNTAPSPDFSSGVMSNLGNDMSTTKFTKFSI